jgi:hypothetical protein
MHFLIFAGSEDYFPKRTNSGALTPLPRSLPSLSEDFRSEIEVTGALCAGGGGVEVEEMSVKKIQLLLTIPLSALR